MQNTVSVSPSVGCISLRKRLNPRISGSHRRLCTWSSLRMTLQLHFCAAQSLPDAVGKTAGFYREHRSGASAAIAPFRKAHGVLPVTLGGAPAHWGLRCQGRREVRQRSSGRKKARGEARKSWEGRVGPATCGSPCSAREGARLLPCWASASQQRLNCRPPTSWPGAPVDAWAPCHLQGEFSKHAFCFFRDLREGRALLLFA